MLTVPQDLMEILSELDATFRFVHVGPTHGPSKTDETKVVMTSPGCVKCEIYDNAVGSIYHFDTGATEAEAMDKAIRGAVHAAKPLTKAQRIGQQAAAANAVKDENESLKARIAELEAAIASKKK